MRLTGAQAEFWPHSAEFVIVAVAALHGVALAVVAAMRPQKRPDGIRGLVGRRSIQVSTLAVALFVAGFALFWIDPSDRYLNFFVRLIFAPPFSESPAPFGLGPALALAILLLAAVAAFGWLERELLRRDSTLLPMIR